MSAEYSTFDAGEGRGWTEGEEDQASVPRPSSQGRRLLAGFIFVATVVVLFSSLVSSPDDAAVPPHRSQSGSFWGSELTFGGKRDSAIRSALQQSGITEQEFWQLETPDLAFIFRGRAGDAIAVRRWLAEARRGVQGNMSGVVAVGARSKLVAAPAPAVDTDLFYALSPTVSYIVGGVLLGVSMLYFAITFDRGGQEVKREGKSNKAIESKKDHRDGKFQQMLANLDIMAAKPEANIYRLMAIVPGDVLKSSGQSPTLLALLALLTGFMQSYVPYKLLISNPAIDVEGIKSLKWFETHWSSCFTSLAAILTIGIIFVNKVENAVHEETMRCYNLLVRQPGTRATRIFTKLEKGDEDAAKKLADKAMKAAKHIEVVDSPFPTPRSPKGAKSETAAEPRYSFCGCDFDENRWEFFWCMFSLLVAVWSGMVLSVQMMYSCATYNGDAGTFVLGVMRVFFLTTIDEQVVKCLPHLDEWYKACESAQDVVDDQRAARYKPYLKAFCTTTTSTMGGLLTGGLLALVLAFCTVNGHAVGVGAST